MMTENKSRVCDICKNNNKKNEGNKYIWEGLSLILKTNGKARIVFSDRSIGICLECFGKLKDKLQPVIQAFVDSKETKKDKQIRELGETVEKSLAVNQTISKQKEKIAELKARLNKSVFKSMTSAPPELSEVKKDVLDMI